MSSRSPVARTPDGPARGDRDTRFFGQPWALAHVFGVEMWERFSFYGMQGILLIYLYFSVADGGLGMPAAVAGLLVAGVAAGAAGVAARRRNR